jgi:hypothetical protein
MLQIVKKDNIVEVYAELKRREFASEAKIWLKIEQIMDELHRKYPEITIECCRNPELIVSNIKEPHNGSWTFVVEDEKKDLTSRQKRVKLKESSGNQDVE